MSEWSLEHPISDDDNNHNCDQPLVAFRGRMRHRFRNVIQTSEAASSNWPNNKVRSEKAESRDTLSPTRGVTIRRGLRLAIELSQQNPKAISSQLRFRERKNSKKAALCLSPCMGGQDIQTWSAADFKAACFPSSISAKKYNADADADADALYATSTALDIPLPKWDPQPWKSSEWDAVCIEKMRTAPSFTAMQSIVFDSKMEQLRGWQNCLQQTQSCYAIPLKEIGARRWRTFQQCLRIPNVSILPGFTKELIMWTSQPTSSKIQNAIYRLSIDAVNQENGNKLFFRYFGDDDKKKLESGLQRWSLPLFEVICVEGRCTASDTHECDPDDRDIRSRGLYNFHILLKRLKKVQTKERDIGRLIKEDQRL